MNSMCNEWRNLYGSRSFEDLSTIVVNRWVDAYSSKRKLEHQHCVVPRLEVDRWQVTSFLKLQGLKDVRRRSLRSSDVGLRMGNSCCMFEARNKVARGNIGQDYFTGGSGGSILISAATTVPGRHPCLIWQPQDCKPCPPSQG